MAKENDNTKKKTLTGVVGKVIDDKTVGVIVSRTYRHPRYLKVMRTDKKYLVHADEPLEEGDKVEIVETRPISKQKKFKVSRVLE